MQISEPLSRQLLLLYSGPKILVMAVSLTLDLFPGDTLGSVMSLATVLILCFNSRITRLNWNSKLCLPFCGRTWNLYSFFSTLTGPSGISPMHADSGSTRDLGNSHTEVGFLLWLSPGCLSSISSCDNYLVILFSFIHFMWHLLGPCLMRVAIKIGKSPSDIPFSQVWTLFLFLLLLVTLQSLCAVLFICV